MNSSPVGAWCLAPHCWWDASSSSGDSAAGASDPPEGFNRTMFTSPNFNVGIHVSVPSRPRLA